MSNMMYKSISVVLIGYFYSFLSYAVEARHILPKTPKQELGKKCKLFCYN